MYKLKIILLSFLFVFTKPVFAQSGDECKYFEVLTYLHTNRTINEQIKKYSLGIVKLKTKFVEFNVSPWVEFLQIVDFRDRANPDNVSISKELINDDKLFYKKYYFDPFKSHLLDSVIERNESKLYLTFSKPIENFLIAEILNFNSEMLRGAKYGRGVRMLFIFNSTGSIKNVIFNNALYH